MEKTKTSSADLSSTSSLIARPPVVVVLGHVDHGKTTLLDKIRTTNLADREPGGISQYLTASVVNFRNRTITFLDTPGHQSFTQMRTRGGEVADLALLVVSAVEGVQAQTQEVLAQILAHHLPYMVVLTKTDLPEADPRRVKEELAKNGVLLEGWGGDVVCLEVSGKTGSGLDALLEMILLQTDLLELRADLKAPFRGTVLEAHLDPKRGPIALILGKEGMLRTGQFLWAGTVEGKVRALWDVSGKVLREIGPSQPAEILGFKKVPNVGESVTTVTKGTAAASTSTHPSTIATGPKALNVVLRADRQGTLEVIIKDLQALEKDGWRVRLLSAATGNVTASDVLLAKTDHAWVAAFAVGGGGEVFTLARENGIPLHFYKIIYELTEAVLGELTNLAKKESLGRRGQGEILKVFTLPSGDHVAGVRVAGGRLQVGQVLKILRASQEIGHFKVKTLKIKTEKVSSVASGNECGLLFVGDVPFAVGDLIEEEGGEQPIAQNSVS